jgi:hypothetical protein
MIEKCAVPANSLLANYLREGNHTDCFTTEIPGQITIREFIFAFYTTWLFKLERFILTSTVARASTDTQAKQLANGEIDRFAAWTVERRSENEILLCDFSGRTRSWLMVALVNDSQTRLYFGSAVVPRRISKTGKPSLGFVFQSLLGFHKIYSILLLHFAKSRITH